MSAPHAPALDADAVQRHEFASRSGTGTVKQTILHQPFEAEAARQKAVKMRRSGSSMQEIGAHFDVPAQAVNRMLKSAGLSFPTYATPATSVSQVAVKIAAQRRKPVGVSVLGLTAEWQEVAKHMSGARTDKWVFKKHSADLVKVEREKGLIVTCQKRDASSGQFVLMARLAPHD